MDRLRQTVLRWCERTSRPLDEVVWRRRRNRAMLWLLGLATLLAVQTAAVHSPDYMINGLYHNRRAHNLQLQTVTPPVRAKLMERLCLSQNLFNKGGVDPYQIPDAEGCAAKHNMK
jgi:hypothetical protein